MIGLFCRPPVTPECQKVPFHAMSQLSIQLLFRMSNWYGHLCWIGKTEEPAEICWGQDVSFLLGSSYGWMQYASKSPSKPGCSRLEHLSTSQHFTCPIYPILPITRIIYLLSVLPPQCVLSRAKHFRSPIPLWPSQTSRSLRTSNFRAQLTFRFEEL